MSGRAVSGLVEDGKVKVSEKGRFHHRQLLLRGHLYWDLMALWRGMLDGLRAAASCGPVESIAIDSWGVDYALVDEPGELVGLPAHYQDGRAAAALQKLGQLIDPESLYGRNGTALDLRHTLVQLLAEPQGKLERANRMLMLPDLFSFWLTGVEGAEVTIASTTGLLSPATKGWDYELSRRLAVPTKLLAPLRRPGDLGGQVEPMVAEEAGLEGTVGVRVVAAHDTASAAVAVPCDTNAPFAFISIGTWSLVGIELEYPVLTEAARVGGFTNEIGVDGKIQFLHKVTGLRLLAECLRTWGREGGPPNLEALLLAANGLPAGSWLVDPDHPSLSSLGDIPARIRALCRRGGRPVPVQPAEVVRCLVDSLALAHRRVLRDAVALCGRDVNAIHIVGGGSRNHLLCQATADACDLPVIAGPAEASAIGNVLVQAGAAGVIPAGLEQLRACAKRSFELRHYRPAGTALWDSLEDRLGPVAGTPERSDLGGPRAS